MALYCTAKAAAFAAALNAGATWGVAILNAWTDADQALWAGVLNFWFLGRVFDRFADDVKDIKQELQHMYVCVPHVRKSTNHRNRSLFG